MTSATDDYIKRHLGNNPEEVKAMLAFLKVKDLEELMDQTVPSTIRLKPNEAFRHGHKKVEGNNS
jgi:glycine cleavage system pyridoxal-binding protein P